MIHISLLRSLKHHQLLLKSSRSAPHPLETERLQPTWTETYFLLTHFLLLLLVRVARYLSRQLVTSFELQKINCKFKCKANEFLISTSWLSINFPFAKCSAIDFNLLSLIKTKRAACISRTNVCKLIFTSVLSRSTFNQSFMFTRSLFSLIQI